MTRWFGGTVDLTGAANALRPVGSQMIWGGRFPLWLAGATWPSGELCVLHGPERDVAVIGPCAASGPQFAVRNDPDVVIAYPGSYTVVQADPTGLRIFTDLGSTWPIYLTTYAGAVVWGSSARALAGLTGAGVDPVWLASVLVDPAATSPVARSPFDGITLAPPGARVSLRPGRPPEIEPAIPIQRGSRRRAVARLRHALEVWLRALTAAPPTPWTLSATIPAGR